MTDALELKFLIDAFTPETMPMARLAEYLSELATFLGERTSVHFVRLESGSTSVVHRIDREAQPKALARVDAVRTGSGPTEALRAYHRINAMLGDDNGSAELLIAGGAQIIDFPGARKPITEFGLVNERGSIDGRLIRIGGKRERVPVTLQRGSIDYTNVFTSRQKAEELGRFLFKPLRLYGTGRWFRTNEGRWILDRFSADNFEALDPETLSGAVTALRLAAGGDWAEEWPAGLQALRHGGDH